MIGPQSLRPPRCEFIFSVGHCKNHHQSGATTRWDANFLTAIATQVIKKSRGLCFFFISHQSENCTITEKKKTCFPAAEPAGGAPSCRFENKTATRTHSDMHKDESDKSHQSHRGRTTCGLLLTHNRRPLSLFQS